MISLANKTFVLVTMEPLIPTSMKFAKSTEQMSAVSAIPDTTWKENFALKTSANVKTEKLTHSVNLNLLETFQSSIDTFQFVNFKLRSTLFHNL